MELKDARDCGSFFLPAAPAAPSPCRAAGKGGDTGQVGCGLLTGQQKAEDSPQRGDWQDTVETAPANRTPTWWGWLAEHLEQ